MRAIVVERGETTPKLMDVPQPAPTTGEVLVRTLRVGIDGTDHEVVAGSHGGYPDGSDYQILGHEAVGVVEDPNGTNLDAGQIVVPDGSSTSLLTNQTNTSKQGSQTWPPPVSTLNAASPARTATWQSSSRQS